MGSFVKRIAPAVGLLFLSPLIAEFLLGDFPLTMLWLLIVLAPFYGGGAILIRESVRRTGRGWPTMMVLALAYGIFEEAFTTQTLFNPNYLGLNLHLLQPAYIASLGIGAWWTVFVLTLHTVWSISVPVALMESLVPARATKPWLGRIGLAVVTLLFVLSATAMTRNSVKMDKAHFMASPNQFLASAIICAIVAVLAFLVPRIVSNRPGNPPRPLVTGACALAAASIFLVVLPTWGWAAVAIYLALYVVMIALAILWSRKEGWTQQHVLSLAAGGALAYAWHSFIAHPVTGTASTLVLRGGDALLTLGAILLIAIAARKTAAVRTTESAALASK
jgi:hypothetical protein